MGSGLHFNSNPLKGPHFVISAFPRLLAGPKVAMKQVQAELSPFYRSSRAVPTGSVPFTLSCMGTGHILSPTGMAPQRGGKSAQLPEITGAFSLIPLPHFSFPFLAHPASHTPTPFHLAHMRHCMRACTHTHTHTHTLYCHLAQICSSGFLLCLGTMWFPLIQHRNLFYPLSSIPTYYLIACR